MKKIYLILLSLFFVQNLYAGYQGISKWKSRGGNIYRSDGYIGIGTSTPTAKLYIDGNCITTGKVSSESAEFNYLNVISTSNIGGSIFAEDLRAETLTVGDATGTVHAQWHFNETSGLMAYDSSGNSRNGTLEGSSPPTFVSGLLNNALEFGAVNDQYVDFGQIGVFDFDEEFSFSIWIKADLAARTRNLISKGDGSDGYVVDIQADGDLEINMRDNSSIRRIQLVLDTNLEDDTWHHIALTYDGSYTLAGLTVKVDNVAPSTLASTDNLNIGDSMLTTNTFQIGALDATNTYRDGLIDEISVYEYVLSSASITQLFNSGAGTEILPTGQNVLVVQKNHCVANSMSLVSRGHLCLTSTNGDTDIILWPGSNVTVGRLTSDEKLHVAGNIKSDYGAIASTGIFSNDSGIALEISGGMLKTGCTAYGSNIDTHINLGSNCESGKDGEDYSNISIIKAIDSKAQEDGTHILGGDTIVITGRNSINIGGQDVNITGNGSVNIASEDVQNDGLICATIAADNPIIESTAKFSVNVGKANGITGDYSFVGGQYMRSEGDNNFVWGVAGSTEPITDSSVAVFFPYGTAGKVGISTGTPQAALHVNGDVILGTTTVNGIFTRSYMEAYISSSEATANETNVWIPIAGTWTLDDSNNFSFLGSTFTYTGSATRLFEVNGSISVSAAAATLANWKLYINSTAVASSEQQRNLPINDKGAVSFSCLVELSQNDEFNIWCVTNDGDDLTHNFTNISIKQIN